MNRREAYIERLSGKQTDHLPFLPLTMMFAADLLGCTYKEYETNASLQAEGQFLVAEQFGTSVVSAISDPVVEASDLGAIIEMTDSSPAAAKEEFSLLSDVSKLSTLNVVDPGQGKRMSNRLEAVHKMAKRAGGSLIVEGWVEGPCAEAADLRGINRLMMDFYDDPPFVEDLMDFIVLQETAFALAQIDAGADIIGIGDAASSLIGPDAYAAYVLPRMIAYVQAIHAKGALVRLHICGNINALYPHIAKLGVDQIDLDWMDSVSEARRICGDRPLLCGNIDPVRVVLQESPAVIHQSLHDCWIEAGMKYCVGAGCEIPRGTPHENLLAMSNFAMGHT